ncbi:MAG: leucine-rich repeat protein [Lachnospiraceae bacterium]|nr:leucine-rich repeat protein [Lachnospiraceae bacterium]
MKLKHETKSVLYLLLAICLMAGLIPCTALHVQATSTMVEVGSWDDLKASDAVTVSTSGDVNTVTLQKDVKATGAFWIINWETAVLDLNGHTIDRGLTGKEAEEYGCVFTIGEGSNLTIKDSSKDSSHPYGAGKITGGNHDFGGAVDCSGAFTLEGGMITGNVTDRFGGGVYVSGGSFTMTGGAIAGNTAARGGGVTASNGTFTMTGGLIEGNKAMSTYGNGGGVYLGNSDSVFTMAGGKIAGNSAKMWGGGVSAGYGTFTMTGGTIEGNNCESDNGGGVFFDDCIFSVGGTPVIRGNVSGGTLDEQTKRYEGGSANDVRASSWWNLDINVIKALEDGAEIRVFDYNYVDTVAQADSGDDATYKKLKASDAEKFISDNEDYVSMLNEDGKVKFTSALKLRVPSIESQTYTGESLIPVVTVKNIVNKELKEGTDYTVTLPENCVNAGVYDVTVTGLGKYAGEEVTKTFEIEKKSITPIVSITDWTYGDTPNSPSVTAESNPGGGAVTYRYKMNANGATLSDVVPTNASNIEYTVIATIAETANYKGGTAEATFKIDKKPVTITGLSVEDKEYDGTTAATITGTAIVSGKVGNDDVTVTGGSATFDNANVGTDKTVTFSGFSLSGESSNNYTLSAQPDDVTADITPKPVTITGVTVTGKTYDGTTAATITGTAIVSGKVGNDDVTVTGGSATFDNANVGTDKTVTFSGFSLSGESSNNYILSAQPTGVTAAITKKTASDVSEISMSYFYSTGSEESIDIAALLPEDCGTYDYIVTKSGDLSYSDDPTVVDGILSYTADPGTIGTTGIITIKAETLNYTDFTITVKIKLSDTKKVALKDGTSIVLNKSTLTYGEAISALTFKTDTAVFVEKGNTSNVIAGSISWKTPTVVPSAGTTSATWVFTPTNVVYEPIEGVVAITVNKAIPIITTVPEASAITYGKTLADSTLSNGEAAVDGKFTWSDMTIKPTVSDSNKTCYEVIFTPNDTMNYKTTSCEVTLLVNKADIPTDTITTPTAKEDLEYDGSSLELVEQGESENGQMQYVIGDDDESAPTEGWSEDIPTATGAKTYYVWYKVVGNDNYNDSEADSVSVTIAKKPISITADSASKPYDGDALTKDGYTVSENDLAKGDVISKVTVTGTQTDVGSSDNVPSAAVIKKGDSDVTSNYDITYKKGKLSVTKADPTYEVPEDKEIACDQTLNDITLGDGFSFADIDQVLDLGENTVNVKYTPTDTTNYNVVENIKIKVTKGHDYGEPTYTWSDDGKSCTATVICKSEGCTESVEGHKVTEKASISSKLKEAATTEKKGTTTYTATFKNTMFTTQTKDVEDIPQVAKQSDNPSDKPADKPQDTPQVETPSDKPQDTPQVEPPADKPQDTTPVETPEVKKAGTILSVAEAKVQLVVTSKTGEEPKATFKKSTDAKAKKIIVPKTVTYDGVKYKVTEVSKNAFKGNKTIETVELSENIETVGENAFYGCTSLKNLILPAKVKKIGKNALKGTKVKTLVIKSVKLTKKAVKNALKGSKVKTVKVDLGNKKLNKQFVKKYKKIFTKKNVGVKVVVK